MLMLINRNTCFLDRVLELSLPNVLILMEWHRLGSILKLRITLVTHLCLVGYQEIRNLVEDVWHVGGAFPNVEAALSDSSLYYP